MHQTALIRLLGDCDLAEAALHDAFKLTGVKMSWDFSFSKPQE
jgi:predicted RNA polymerase sigma factor